jgi:hypothetical protein
MAINRTFVRSAQVSNTEKRMWDQFLDTYDVDLGSSKGGTVYYIDPQNGSASYDGLSWEKAKVSFDALDSILDHGDTILFRGVYKGNWTTPEKNDVSIIGVMNTPRQATSDGVANGAGSTWLSLASPTTAPLLKILGQAWTVQNIFFNNAATAYPDIWLHRDESAGQDASHALIQGCKFTGSDDGIKQSGGCNYVRILDNVFFGFAGAGDIAISSESGTGDGTGYQWEIARNLFEGNVHNIIVPMNAATIHDNTFVKVGHTITSTSMIDLTSAGHVIVHDNVMGHAAVESPNDTLYVDGTACLWINNKCSDGVKYTKPDNA